MAVAEPAIPHLEKYDEISLIDIFLWMVKWGWLLLIGGLMGLLAGFVVHLVSEERSVVSVDIAITETPLGAQAFIQDVSVSILRNHMGAATIILPDSRKGILSLSERDVAEDATEPRKAAMVEAAAALSGALQTMVSEEYARMQTSFSAMRPSPETYAALTPLRLYLEALDEGLLEPVTVVSQSVRRQGAGLKALLAIGLLAGAGIGAGVALFTDQLRRYKKISAA